MSAAVGAKRKIGGHFGSAVGASTKRGRGGCGWRDEVDDVDGKAEDTPLERQASGSEEALDPGTPLPSESEDGETSGKHDPATESAAAPGQDTPLETDGDGNVKNDSAVNDRGEQGTVVTESEPTAINGQVAQSVVVSLELLVAGSSRGTLRISLHRGLDDAAEKRLSPCLLLEGSTIEVSVRDNICAFGNDDPSSSTTSRPAKCESDTKKDAEDEIDDQVVDECASTPAGSTANGSSTDVTTLHAGMLIGPANGTRGLAITLPAGAPSGWPGGGDHLELGTVLFGKTTLRKLAALSSLIPGGSKPALPAHLRAIRPSDTATGVGAGIAEAASTAVATSGPGVTVPQLAISEKEAVVHHKSFLLTVPPAFAANGNTRTPFLLEAEQGKNEIFAEDLEVLELELDCRESEITELKQMRFSRERQCGVESVHARLVALEEHLKNLANACEGAAAVSLDESLVGQRLWLQQRARHLLRILDKLR